MINSNVASQLSDVRVDLHDARFGGKWRVVGKPDLLEELSANQQHEIRVTDLIGDHPVVLAGASAKLRVLIGKVHP